MQYLPVFLDLKTGPVLLIGAGELVRAKLRVLLAAGARIRWFATDGDFELGGLHDYHGQIARAEGDPMSADLSGVRCCAPAPATSVWRCRRGRAQSVCPSM